MQRGIPSGKLVAGGLGERFVAKIIDVAFVIVLSEVFRRIWIGHTPLSSEAFEWATLLTIGLFLVAYNAVFLERVGTTPGKWLMDLAVVEFTGVPVSGGRAFGRSFGEIFASGWLCLVGWYGLRAFSDFDSMIGLNRIFIEQPMVGLILLSGFFYNCYFLAPYGQGENRMPHDRLFGTRVVCQS